MCYYYHYILQVRQYYDNDNDIVTISNNISVNKKKKATSLFFVTCDVILVHFKSNLLNTDKYVHIYLKIVYHSCTED